MSEFVLQPVTSLLLANSDQSSFEALFTKKFKQVGGVQTVFFFLKDHLFYALKILRQMTPHQAADALRNNQS